MLHNRHRDAHDVGLLERVGADDAARHLSGDNHKRHAVHVGGRDARDRIGGARPARHDGHADAARRPRIAVRLVHGTLLVAREHMAEHLRVVERVVDLDSLPTRVAEYQIDSLGLERGDDRLGSRHGFTLLLRLVRAHERTAPLSADVTSFAYRAKTP